MANAAFMHSSQRKGSCTKRNLGKCCQSKLLTENIRTALAVPQAESSIHSVPSPVALRATGQPNNPSPRKARGLGAPAGAAVPTCFVHQRREPHIATARRPISASATVETKQLKRL